MYATRPDRLASALLIIGFILVSLFGFYSIGFRFAGGRHLPPLFLTTIILGGTGILYGWFRTVRGNPETKQLFKATFQKIRIGAMAGSVAAFVLVMISQINEVNGSWLVAFFVLSITWGLLFGIPFGGIGGLILASIWKNKKSAFVGGVSAVAIISLLRIIFVFHRF